MKNETRDELRLTTLPPDELESQIKGLAEELGLAISAEEAASLASGREGFPATFRTTASAILLPEMRSSIEQMREQVRSREVVERLKAIESRIINTQLEDLPSLKEEVHRLRGTIETDKEQLEARLNGIDKISHVLKEISLIADVLVAKGHEARIQTLQNWMAQHSADHAEAASRQVATARLSQSVWGNRIAWIVLVATVILGILNLLIQLGWIGQAVP
jgi:small-conductance mechanosensitive channel